MVPAAAPSSRLQVTSYWPTVLSQPLNCRCPAVRRVSLAGEIETAGEEPGSPGGSPAFPEVTRNPREFDTARGVSSALCHFDTEISAFTGLAIKAAGITAVSLVLLKTATIVAVELTPAMVQSTPMCIWPGIDSKFEPCIVTVRSGLPAAALSGEIEVIDTPPVPPPPFPPLPPPPPAVAPAPPPQLATDKQVTRRIAARAHFTLLLQLSRIAARSWEMIESLGKDHEGFAQIAGDCNRTPTCFLRSDQVKASMFPPSSTFE